MLDVEPLPVADDEGGSVRGEVDPGGLPEVVREVVHHGGVSLPRGGVQPLDHARPFLDYLRGARLRVPVDRAPLALGHEQREPGEESRALTLCVGVLAHDLGLDRHAPRQRGALDPDSLPLHPEVGEPLPVIGVVEEPEVSARVGVPSGDCLERGCLGAEDGDGAPLHTHPRAECLRGGVALHEGRHRAGAGFVQGVGEPLPAGRVALGVGGFQGSL